MARIRRLALPLALLAVALVAATASAIPVVDPTVPAAHETEPVILTGVQLGDWSTPSDASAKAPLTDLPGAGNCFADDTSTDCDKHNNYAQPDVDASPALPSGEPIDHFLGFKWDAKTSKWQEIPLQVDEMFTRYLDNQGSGFSLYSGDDQHTTYAYDREGFRYTKEDSSDPCHAQSATPPAPDPVKGLDNNDELTFMAKDAGAEAPSGTPLPADMVGAKAVALTDPTNPGGAPTYAYIMKSDGKRKPYFNADNGYVRYVRDANADTFGFSQSDYEGYGNAARGHFYWPGDATHPAGCYGGDPSQLGKGVCARDKIHPSDPHFFECPQRHRPLDRAWVTTPNYRFRYDGRWLLTQLQVSTDGGQTYGPDMIDRWKARAFQQDPESETPCCGYEEEDTNWGGSSTLLGERVGAVRAIRETWGADSGTNVIRRETFYAQQIRQKSYLRVHVIPPLDGIYAQWDFNAGAATKYFNPMNDTAVPVDGHNDEVFGNLDDPCTAHYDQNDTGQFTQGYRQAYNQLTLCSTPRQVYDDCPGGRCHQSMDLMDPSFSGAPNASLNWNEITGPAGTMVDRYTIEKATDLSPGGAAQSAFAIPYYRDDSCFDDGTGSDPGPKLKPRDGMLSEPTAKDGTARHCWNHLTAKGSDQSKPNPLDPAVPGGDDHFFQGDVGTHGVHILLIADSDNARQTVPVDEIVSEQRIAILPPNQGDVGEQYGRSFEKPIEPVAVTYMAGTGTGAEEPPAGAQPTADGQPAPYPGESNPPAPAPATTKPEATETAEGSVLGVRASSGCLPAPQKLQSHGIGRLRLGRRPSETLLRNSRPVTGHPGLVVWCVSGNGRVVAALAKNGTVRFIASTATSSKARGIAPGSSTRRLAHKGLRKLARDLFVTRRGTKAVIGIAGKHVQFVGVADRSLLTHARQLRLYAVAIDL